MIASNVYNNFASGELSPSVWGRIDRPFYQTGLEICRDFIPLLTGGAFFRPGFAYIHHTRLNQKAFLITFKFNAAQSYTLEFTALKMRVFKNGGVVLETAKNVTGITAAAQGVVTSATHGFADGNEVYFSGVVGMTQVNGQFYIVSDKDANTFKLKDIDGNYISTAAFTAYASGGTVARVYEVTSPYAEADMWQIKTAQTADLMYLVHPSYAPYKLTRAGHANWTLATYVRTADPFTGAGKYPGGVGFYGGRLWMGGSNDDPDIFNGSMGPDPATGAARYDNFTVGTAALDAVVYTVSSQNDTADRILWFASSPAYMVIGTSGGVYKANGGVDGSPITPTAIAVNPVSSYGAADVGQIFVGNQLVYLQTGARTLRSFEYDLLSDAYYAFDKNLLAEEVTAPSVTQIAVSQGRPDIIWGVRSDGVLLSCTFLAKEDVAGWARHYIGGSGKVLSVAAEPQATGFDRVSICVERTIDGHTRRYIEYSSLDPLIPDFSDYYTGAANRVVDELKYRNIIFELQKTFARMDSYVVLDTTQAVTLTLSAVSGTAVTATAGSASFKAADVGKYIFIKYITGLEAGVAQITGYTNTTVVTINILQTFGSTSVVASGWYLLSSTVQGLGHLEGETVGILTDGGVHADKVVTAGMVTLEYPSRYTIIGKKYPGYFRTLDLELGAAKAGGSAQGTLRNLIGLSLKLKDTLGGSYGSSSAGMYALAEMNFRNSAHDLTDRPPLLFSGMKPVTNFDDWATEKRLHIIQDQPLPITILSMVPIFDVTGE
jgi:hypothetical protein